MWVGESLDEAIRTTLLLVIADHIIPRMSVFHRQIHLLMAGGLEPDDL